MGIPNRMEKTKSEVEFCDGCFNPISECKEYGSCFPRLKTEISNLQDEVAAMQKVVEAARKIGTDHSGLCAEGDCNCTGKALDKVILALQIKVIDALRKEKP